MNRQIILDTETTGAEQSIGLVISCVEYIYDKDNVYSEFSRDEIGDWMDNLNNEQYEKINSFFESIPKLTYDLEWKCEKCGEKDKIHLEGLSSFFI